MTYELLDPSGLPWKDGAKWPASPNWEEANLHIPGFEGRGQRYILLRKGYSAQVYGMWFRQDSPAPVNLPPMDTLIQRGIEAVNEVLFPGYQSDREKAFQALRGKISVCNLYWWSAPTKENPKAVYLGSAHNGYRNANDLGNVVCCGIKAINKDSIIEIGYDADPRPHCSAGYLKQDPRIFLIISQFNNSKNDIDFMSWTLVHKDFNVVDKVPFRAADWIPGAAFKRNSDVRLTFMSTRNLQSRRPAIAGGEGAKSRFELGGKLAIASAILGVGYYLYQRTRQSYSKH